MGRSTNGFADVSAKQAVLERTIPSSIGNHLNCFKEFESIIIRKDSKELEDYKILNECLFLLFFIFLG